MSVSQNPFREGEYLIYGEAEPTGEGRWAAYYWVDHQPEGEPLMQRVVERRRFGVDAYGTADLARMFAVQAGQQHVRQATG